MGAQVRRCEERGKDAKVMLPDIGSLRCLRSEHAGEAIVIAMQ
jgi:hypothetical protein